MLKYTASSIAPSITELLNWSIRSGRLPDEWKLSMIVQIPKGSRNQILQIIVQYPLFAYFLIKKHIEYLNATKDLSATQWGFHSGRSTVTALLSVTQEWFTALESGKEICAIF